MEYTFFVAESIKTAAQLKKDCKKKYIKISSFTTENGMNGKAPAIVTYARDKTSIGLKKHMFDNDNTINWGKDINCDRLNPEDIVIDHDMKQIFPKKTGKMPIVLEKLLEGGKERNG
jgi:hypothetical protein